MGSTRFANTVKNSFAALVAQIVSILLNFVSRTVFIKVLGAEYLGINGLFSNILSMLSLTEMGIGTAIVFNMYRAVKDKDDEKINELMSFYAKVYTIIGFCVLAIGFVISFFIQTLIKNNTFDNSFLQICFLIFVVNNATSYFLSYRSCILFANQKDWMCKLSSTLVTIVGIVVQIVFLLVFKNFILYLSVLVGITFLSNLIQFILSKKLYPNVKISIKSKLSKDTSQDIKKRVGSLMLHSVSSALNFGTDNIIISKFVGILETGLYSNYSMLLTTLNTLIVQFLNGVVASFGNLVAEGNKNKIYEVFKKIDFICKSMYGVITVGLFSVLNLFINLWVGQNNLLNTITVLILVINFYTLGVRQSIMITRNAAGLYTNDKIVAIVKPIINLTVSIILVQFIGITGVFLGTLTSQLVCDIFMFPIILFKNQFKGKIAEYYLDYLKNIVVVLICSASCVAIRLGLSNYIDGWFLLVASGFASVAIYTLFFVAVNKGTENYIFFKNIVGKYLSKFKRKVK